MGRGFEYHQGHWWCQEGHPTTIAPVFQRQISPKTRSEKKPNSGLLTGYGGFKRTWHEFYIEVPKNGHMRLDLKQVCGGAFEHPSLRSGNRARKSHVALRHGVSPSWKVVERMDFADFRLRVMVDFGWAHEWCESTTPMYRSSNTAKSYFAAILATLD